MRLFPQQQAREHRASEEEAVAARVNLLKEQVIGMTKTLNLLRSEKDDFERQLAADKASATARLESELAALRRDVASLEDRRREAERPLTDERDKLKIYEQDLNREKDHLAHLREETRQEQEWLVSEKEKLADALSALKDETDKVSREKVGAISQAAHVTKLNRDLNERIAAFNERVAEHEARLAEKNAELVSREALIAADKEYIRGEKENISKSNAWIVSEREVLRLAREEFKKKGII